MFNGLLYAHITKNGQLVSLSTQFVPEVAEAAERGVPNRVATQTFPPVDARDSVAAAARAIGEDLAVEVVAVLDGVVEGTDQRQRFDAARLLGDANASLVWIPMDRQTVRLGWKVTLTGATKGELFQVVVDTQTGEALVRNRCTFDLTAAQYLVYNSDSPTPKSPGYATPVITQPTDDNGANEPAPNFVPQTTMYESLVGSAVASPQGWINPGATNTLGNNVDAHPWSQANPNPNYADPVYRPQSATLQFNFTAQPSQSPTNSANQDAAIVNAFYWCNWMHDRLYEFGFTEAAGNYQQNNFGRGGAVGGDAVLVDVQDQFGPRFSVNPADGTAGRLELRINTSSGSVPPGQNRDPAMEAEYILHEYTHGMSQRLVGHGSGISTSCPQSQGLGEGWSDFYSLALLSQSGDDLNGNYAWAAYSFYGERDVFDVLIANYYFGFRRYPYSTAMANNPLTFTNIYRNPYPMYPLIPKNPKVGLESFPPSEAHASGEVWCTMLWEARAKLITKHTFTVGNPLILQLVTDGMRLCPPNPNFAQARDAILLADRVNTGGANQTELWAAFAKRGLGWGAVCPPSSSADNSGLIESYLTPPQYGKIWEHYAGGGTGDGIYSSPAIGPDGTIYVGVGYPEHRVRAVNPDGTLKWTYDPGGAYDSFYSSPAFGPDGTVYIGCNNGYLYALDGQTGSLKWNPPVYTGGSIFSSPAVGPDGTIYVGVVNSTGNVRAYWPSGTLRWSTTTGNNVYSSPVVGPDGTVYVGSLDNKLHAIDPVTGQFKTGNWPVVTGGFVYSSPAVATDGTIYVGSFDGKLYARNPNGSEKWTQAFSTTAQIWSSPAIGPDGTVYVGREDNKLHALRPTDGYVNWSFPGGNWIRSSPAVASDGTIFVGCFDGYFYGINPNGTLKANWPFPAGGAVFSSPALGTNGIVYVGANNGKLYALSNSCAAAQSPWPMFRRNNRRTAYDWHPVGGGVQPGQAVYALSLGSGNTLNVGGNFLTAGGITVNRVARWNGTSWLACGTGLSDGFAAAIGSSGSAFYVGGGFANASGSLGPNFGKWTGTGWTTQVGPNGPVYAVAIAPNGDLYAGGQFSSVNGMAVNNIFRIRTGMYERLGTSPNDGVNGPVQGIAIDTSGQVYVGGTFTLAGGASRANIAKWANEGWNSVGNGTSAAVSALAVDAISSDIYVTGFFTTVYNTGGSVSANGVAKWSGSSWSALGQGLQDKIKDANDLWVTVPAAGYALAVNSGKVYAGGNFSLAGGRTAARVAHWDGTQWLPLGSGVAGVDAVVEAVGLTSDYVYIGGNFEAAGGMPAYGIARWKR